MAISIIAMTLLDYFVEDVYTQKIPVISSLQPTLADERGWFVDPAGIHAGWMFAAVIPAVFVSILLFMETELTGIVLNKKENNLQKGGGYNLDLLVVGLVCGLCSFMGLPWICAAPVRSVSHKNALTIMSTTHAPGESAHVVRVIEQRVTNIFIHIFIGGYPFVYFSLCCSFASLSCAGLMNIYSNEVPFAELTFIHENCKLCSP